MRPSVQFPFRGLGRSVVLILCLAALASATCDARAGSLRVPEDFATIQAAVNAAAPGDLVDVAPGFYFEEVDFSGKAIHVRARGENTVIAGEQAHPCVTFQSGEGPDSILEGFMLTGGRGRNILGSTFGGAIYCTASSPSVLGNHFSGNVADFGGGMACLGGSSPVIRGNTFEGEGANMDGGAIYIESASNALVEANEIRGCSAGGFGSAIAIIDAGAPTVHDNRIESNLLSGFSGFGGTVAAVRCNPVITENEFRRNQSMAHSAGVYLSQSFAVVDHNHFEDNETAWLGGAVVCLGDGTPTITSNTMHRNTADDGGAIGCDMGASPLIARNQMTENETTGRKSLGGGAVAVLGGSEPTLEHNEMRGNRTPDLGGAIAIEDATANLRDNRIDENESELFGGAVFARNAVLRIRRGTMDRNHGRTGGALALVDSELLIEGAMVTRNIADFSGGGLLLDRSSAVLTNVTFAHNEAGTSGGAIQTNGTSPRREIGNAILWGNRAPQGPQIFEAALGLVITSSDIEGGWPGAGNVDIDPLFAQPAAGDFRLRLASPLIDAGDPGAVQLGPLDFEGEDRTLDGDADGVEIVDIGADEVNSLVAARFGSVDAASGSLANVLFANGTAGDDAREIVLSVGEALMVTTMPSPSGPEPGGFAIYAYPLLPDPGTITPQPFGLGTATFPTPLNRNEGRQYAKLWNNLGFESRLGEPDFPSAPAPSTLVDLPGGIGFAVDVTFQGFIEDAGSTADGPASLTNAVIVRVID